MSQKRNFPQSLAVTLAFRLRSLKLRFFRSGTFLHGRYPLPCYYGPVRLPSGTNYRLFIPCSCSAPAGLPGSFTDLSTRAAPSHPDEPDDCLCPLLHRRSQASSTSVDWPLISFV